MIHKIAWRAVAGTLLVLTSLAAFQRPFRQYPGREYNDFPLPRDYQDKAEWVFARLMYPPAMYGGRGFRRGRFGGGDWTQGYSSWTTDYPRSDRHFAEAMRRLTRVHSRSVEQPVNLDEGDAYDWPFLYAVEVGHWQLTDAQAKALREYLLRGGFFMCDDFHGTQEWEVFRPACGACFPTGRLWTSTTRTRSSTRFTIWTTATRSRARSSSAAAGPMSTMDTRPSGAASTTTTAALMVAICHNMDLGDSWEHADNPQYPEKYSALGIRIGVNYVVYAMTH